MTGETPLVGLGFCVSCNEPAVVAVAINGGGGRLCMAHAEELAASLHDARAVPGVWPVSRRDEERRKARKRLVGDMARIFRMARDVWPITEDDTDAEADLCDAIERWQEDMQEPRKALKRRGLA